MKQQIFAAILVTVFGVSAYGAEHKGLESAEPIKQPSVESKKALVVYDDGIWGCPDTYSVYIQRLKPPVDKSHPENQSGDFQSYLYVADGNVLISRTSQQFVIACLKEKK